MTDERVTIRVDDETLIRHAYASFNSKDIDAALADIVRDVDSPNMIEGHEADWPRRCGRALGRPVRHHEP
jgi:ketosteroid isomerase-like protein